MNYYRTNKYIVAFFVLSIFLLSACSKNKVETSGSLLNTNHLEHLYKEIKTENKTLGTIWIYSDAPNYELVTDDDEGYTCVDDVARAMVFYCRQFKHEPSSKNLYKIQTLANFVLHMKSQNGYFYNFVFPDESINEIHPNSIATPNFWTWRAFWALSELIQLNDSRLVDLKQQSMDVLDEVFEKIKTQFDGTNQFLEFDGIRVPSEIAHLGGDQIALIIVGLTNYYQKNPSDEVKSQIEKIASFLVASQFGNENNFPFCAFVSWKNYWHGWGNSQAYALLYSGRILSNETFIEAGLKEVKYFYPYLLEENHLKAFQLRKQDDKISAFNVEKFEQIAYAIRPMVFASIEAYKNTQENAYAIQATELAKWLFGQNPANRPMYNPKTGITFDGINSGGQINENSGAESTIEALLTIQAIEGNEISKQILNDYINNDN